MELEKLSGLDEVFLQIEKPTHLMTIAGVYIFPPNEAPNFDKVIEVFEKMVRDNPRFKAKPMKHGTTGTFWEPCSDFDIHEHVKLVALPEPGTHEQLEVYLSELMSTPFDLQKPLWQSHLITGATEGTVLITRMHHCIADGQGSVRMVLSLTQPIVSSSTEALQHGKQLEKQPPASKNSKWNIWTLLLLPLMLIFYIWQFIIMTAKMIEFSIFSKKSFKIKNSGTQKRVSWTQVSLDDVKKIKNHFNCTVNDVLVAVLTGAIRNAVIEEKIPLDSKFLCAIPVSMRALDDWSLTNKAVTVGIWLPANIEDPVKRLKEIQKRMTQLKKSPESKINYSVYQLIGRYIPSSFSRFCMDKCHAVMTNVPGPAVPLAFAGKPVKSYVALIPQVGAGGLGAAIMSYTDKVTMSILGDIPTEKHANDTVVCPKVITRHIQKEFDALMALLPR